MLLAVLMWWQPSSVDSVECCLPRREPGLVARMVDLAQGPPVSATRSGTREVGWEGGGGGRPVHLLRLLLPACLPACYCPSACKVIPACYCLPACKVVSAPACLPATACLPVSAHLPGCSPLPASHMHANLPADARLTFLRLPPHVPRPPPRPASTWALPPSGFWAPWR